MLTSYLQRKRLTTTIALAALLSVALLAAPAAHAAPTPWQWAQSNTDGFGGANPAGNQQTAALAMQAPELFAPPASKPGVLTRVLRWEALLLGRP